MNKQTTPGEYHGITYHTGDTQCNDDDKKVPT